MWTAPGHFCTLLPWRQCYDEMSELCQDDKGILTQHTSCSTTIFIRWQIIITVLFLDIFHFKKRITTLDINLLTLPFIQWITKGHTYILYIIVDKLFGGFDFLFSPTAAILIQSIPSPIKIKIYYLGQKQLYYSRYFNDLLPFSHQSTGFACDYLTLGHSVSSRCPA